MAGAIWNNTMDYRAVSWSRRDFALEPTVGLRLFDSGRAVCPPFEVEHSGENWGCFIWYLPLTCSYYGAVDLSADKVGFIFQFIDNVLACDGALLHRLTYFRLSGKQSTQPIEATSQDVASAPNLALADI